MFIYSVFCANWNEFEFILYIFFCCVIFLAHIFGLCIFLVFCVCLVFFLYFLYVLLLLSRFWLAAYEKNKKRRRPSREREKKKFMKIQESVEEEKLFPAAVLLSWIFVLFLLPLHPCSIFVLLHGFVILYILLPVLHSIC